jgi:hypothetical protein
MLGRRSNLIVFGMMLATMLAGCKPNVTTLTKKLLLLEVRLERTHSGKTEIVSKVRFIPESDASASVFLPCGNGFGIGIAFLPEVSPEGQIVLSRATYAEKFFPEDILGKYAGRPSKDMESSGGAGTTFRANMGEDIVFVQGGVSRSNNDVSYKVVVNCERTVDRSNMTHILSSLFDVNGERLHQTNVAVPEIMSGGVELGAMVGKKADSE